MWIVAAAAGFTFIFLALAALVNSAFILFLIWVTLGGACLVLAEVLNKPAPPPRDMTQEELDEDAALIRAKSRHAEAVAEYEMKCAELNDTRHFLNNRK